MASGCLLLGCFLGAIGSMHLEIPPRYIEVEHNAAFLGKVQLMCLLEEANLKRVSLLNGVPVLENTLGNSLNAFTA